MEFPTRASYFSNSFNFLNILMKLCTVFGMCPPVFPRDSDRTISFVWYKIYCTLWGATSVAVTAYVMYRKNGTDTTVLPYPIQVADNFAHFSLTVTSLVMIISMVYTKSKGGLLKKMLQSMDYVDDKLKYNIHLYKRTLYTLVFFYISLIVTYVIYDAFTWSYLLGRDWYFLYMPKTIQICQFSLGMLLPMSLLSLIHLRIKGFNKALRHYSNIKFAVANPGFHNGGPVDENHRHFFKDMCHVHTDLYQMVKNFNKIFGSVVLVGTLMAIGLIVHYIVILLVFFQFTAHLEEEFRHLVLTQCITGMLIPLIQLTALSHMGDKVAFEASKTSNISITLLNKFPVHSAQSEAALTEELKLLVMQCSFRTVVISAKRFFPINHTMLGFVISALGSYIILVMQFLSVDS